MLINDGSNILYTKFEFRYEHPVYTCRRLNSWQPYIERLWVSFVIHAIRSGRFKAAWSQLLNE